MEHPLLNPLRNLYFYFTLWLVVFLLHGLVLWGSGSLDWSSAWLDAVVFNVTYSVIALSIWYSCKYISFEKSSLAKFCIGHLLEALLSSLLWLAMSYGLLFGVIGITTRHGDFLKESFIWRLLIGVLFYFVSAAFYYVFIYLISTDLTFP